MAAARPLGSVLPVLLHPAAALRAKCAPIPSLASCAALLADLAASAAAHGGLGLAAPQLGAPLRAFAMMRPVVWTEKELLARALGGQGRRGGARRGSAAAPPAAAYITCVNPRILHASAASRVGVEGCLSLPGAPALVRRAHTLTVEYLDARGERTELELSGLPAVVFQHELDHLDGVLLIDKQEALPAGREEEHMMAANRAFMAELREFFPR